MGFSRLLRMEAGLVKLISDISHVTPKRLLETKLHKIARF